MSRYPHTVPDYTETVEASPIGGRHDRIMIDFENKWRGTGSQEAFLEFRRNLAGMFLDDSGGEYRLFTSPGEHLHPVTTWKISNSNRANDGTMRMPLFSGRLFAKQLSSASSEGMPQWNFTAELSFNPTRWLTQQSIQLARLPNEQWLDTPCNMFHLQREDPDFELPLVRSDNVHVGTSRRQLLARRDMWMVQVERYLRGALDLIDRTLSQAANEYPGFHIEPCGVTASLKQVETYWEFWSERPLEEMARLSQPIQQMAASSSTNWSPLSPEAQEALSATGAVEVGIEDNSPRVQMRAAAGTTMRAYAKTNRRLRFEVSHNCKDARAVFQPYTGLSLEQLLSRLDFARERGAHTVNEVLTFARTRITAPEQSREVHELFADIFRCATTPDVASTIVSMLVTNGRIVTGAGFNIDLATIRTLTRRGVLVRRARQSDSYVWGVTAQYEAGLRMMQAFHIVQS